MPWPVGPTTFAALTVARISPVAVVGHVAGWLGSLFVALPHSHVGMLFANDVAAQVGHFLRHGRFEKGVGDGV